MLRVSNSKPQNQEYSQNMQELIDPDGAYQLVTRLEGIDHAVSTEEDNRSQY